MFPANSVADFGASASHKVTKGYDVVSKHSKHPNVQMLRNLNSPALDLITVMTGDTTADTTFLQVEFNEQSTSSCVSVVPDTNTEYLIRTVHIKELLFFFFFINFSTDVL